MDKDIKKNIILPMDYFVKKKAAQKLIINDPNLSPITKAKKLLLLKKDKGQFDTSHIINVLDDAQKTSDKKREETQEKRLKNTQTKPMMSKTSFALKTFAPLALIGGSAIAMALIPKKEELFVAPVTPPNFMNPNQFMPAQDMSLNGFGGVYGINMPHFLMPSYSFAPPPCVPFGMPGVIPNAGGMSGEPDGMAGQWLFSNLGNLLTAGTALIGSNFDSLKDDMKKLKIRIPITDDKEKAKKIDKYEIKNRKNKKYNQKYDELRNSLKHKIANDVFESLSSNTQKTALDKIENTHTIHCFDDFKSIIQEKLKANNGVDTQNDAVLKGLYKQFKSHPSIQGLDLNDEDTENFYIKRLFKQWLTDKFDLYSVPKTSEDEQTEIDKAFEQVLEPEKIDGINHKEFEENYQKKNPVSSIKDLYEFNLYNNYAKISEGTPIPEILRQELNEIEQNLSNRLIEWPEQHEFSLSNIIIPCSPKSFKNICQYTQDISKIIGDPETDEQKRGTIFEVHDKLLSILTLRHLHDVMHTEHADMLYDGKFKKL